MNHTTISLNLHGYDTWTDRRPRIVKYLDACGADVVVLQEVRFDRSFSADNQADDINSSLTEPYTYIASAITKYYIPSSGKPYREGLAILSKKPIARSEALALTRESDDRHQRIILNADINTGNLILKISNVHLSNNVHSADQLRQVLTIFKERYDKRILVGDFNVFDMEPQREMLDGYKLSTDFMRYVSYPSEDATLDYMLLPHEYMFTDVTTMDGLSDHAAIMYTIVSE